LCGHYCTTNETQHSQSNTTLGIVDNKSVTIVHFVDDKFYEIHPTFYLLTKISIPMAVTPASLESLHKNKQQQQHHENK